MIEQIEEFLKSKPGYLKKGAKRLQNILAKKGIYATEEEVRQSQKNIKNDNNFVEDYIRIKLKEGEKSGFVDDIEEWNKDSFLEKVKGVKNNEIPEGFRIKSKWQGANGEWLMSLERIEDKEYILSKEDIQELITDIIVKNDVQTFIKPSFSYDFSRKDLKVWTSDKHIGADTSESMFDNHYSPIVFGQRMNKLYNHIEQLHENNGVFETITIADLGDAIDGMDGYTVSRNHKLKQNLTNKEMFKVYLGTHKHFFDNLFRSGMANNYQVWLVTNSNHGGDFEAISVMALAEYLKVAYPEVEVKIFEDFINHIEHEGITYMLTHGKDKENRKFGLPLYPDAKTEMLIENYLHQHKISRGARVRLIKGDLHQSASCPCKNIEKYRNVASMFGSSGWVMDNYGMTEAAVDYEILDLNTGVIEEGILPLQ